MDKNEEWYLKYTPEITEEVFLKIQNKLSKELGSQFKHASLDTSYQSFEENKYIRTVIKNPTLERSTRSWCIDNNPQCIKTEKFLKDILSPQSTELTSLPEKWQIYVNDWNNQNSQDEAIYKWRKSLPSNNGPWLIKGYINNTGYFTEEQLYPILSFDQFHKWVLKTPESSIKEEKWQPNIGDWVVILKSGFNNSSHKWYCGIKESTNCLEGAIFQVEDIDKYSKYLNGYTIKIGNSCYGSDYVRKATPDEMAKVTQSTIPEYVECIKNLAYDVSYYTSGQIYKVVKVDGNTPTLLTNLGKEHSVYHGLNHPNPESNCTHFKPSTKKAFDAQNTPKSSPVIEEDWCTKCTEFNKSDLVKYLENTYKGQMNGYYGKKEGKFHSNWDVWGKLLTTEEFYAKIGKSMPNKEENLVGRWLKALVDSPQSTNLKVGQYDKIVAQWDSIYKWRTEKGWCYTQNVRNTSNWELMPINWTPEQDNKQSISLTPKECMSKEELLEYAKKTYLVGIEFKSEFDDNGKIREIQCYPGYDKNGKGLNFRFTDTDSIRISISTNKGGCSDPLIYKNGKWVDIISPKQESKIEVFPGIFVGDVVVGLKEFPGSREIGDIYEVLQKSSNRTLYYKEHSCTSDPNSGWRIASPEEVEWYNKGIRNIKDIPKEAHYTDGMAFVHGAVGELPYKDIHKVFIDPYYEDKLTISEVFKSKKSAKMSYIAENSQSPRQLNKVVKQKSISI